MRIFFAGFLEQSCVDSREPTVCRAKQHVERLEFTHEFRNGRFEQRIFGLKVVKVQAWGSTISSMGT